MRRQSKRVAATALIFMAGLGAVMTRLLSRRRSLPCPAWLSLLLENPYMDQVAGAGRLMDRAGVAPGHLVLDAGCGPGRLTVPLARRVGPAGRVMALDLQPRMLARARARARARVAAAGLANVDFVLAGLGEGHLPPATFDRAFLVTVLGEIPNRAAALAEIRRALKPGGMLSVTEVLPDPHFQTRRTVCRLARQAGFTLGSLWSAPWAYTWHLLNGPATGRLTPGEAADDPTRQPAPTLDPMAEPLEG